uniref:BPTI/Kunitz inhibitor domain-containing protein n=1 Tax=Sinocyclocheilus rhinocerous TaxID=307959 RepID=A0A673I632_9TELE
MLNTCLYLTLSSCTCTSIAFKLRYPNSCILPMEEGNCSRYTLRWYFNSEVGVCRPFIYSGCGGNCQHLQNISLSCSMEGNSCILPMEEGNCSRYTLRWYFNSEVGVCRPFIYSGCGGNANHFLQKEECEKLCLQECDFCTVSVRLTVNGGSLTRLQYEKT